MKHIFLLLAGMSSLFAQFSISGNINPQERILLKNKQSLDMPFRFGEVNVAYTLANFDLITNTTVEYRWSNTEIRFESREFYLAWYPSFGEIRFGNQINSWGLADGNNPTDNLNPYDFYYMFGIGTDRKLGVLSLTLDYYLGDNKLGIIFIPQHTPSRLVYNEPDFPMSSPINPDTLNIRSIVSPFQWGISFQSMLGSSDIVISYLNGYDPVLSLAKINPLEFSYRKTHILGFNLLSFWDDFTFRNELGYFYTQTADDWYLEYIAQYLQGVSQIEWASLYGATFMGQLIYSNIVDVSPVNLEDDFQMNMGTPFASFSESALMLSTQKSFWDNRLEISLFTMANLKETGFMTGMGFDYSPFENWNLGMRVNQFKGDGNLRTDNPFNKLESFSHLSMGLKYSF